MKFIELKQEVNKFRESVKTYSDLLFESRDDVIPEIVKNFDEINNLRSSLIKNYASLEKYIKKIGRNTKLNDGAWKGFYSPYDNAFTNDTLLRVVPSTDAIIDDLDYIIGRLNSMVEEEFQRIMNPISTDQEKQSKKEKINYWNFVNPIWILWQIIIFTWKHKIISAIITGLIVAYLSYKFGWIK